MKKNEDILEKIGRKSGYKVPEGYFEQFAVRMTEQLPQREIAPVEKVSTWQRLKPYIYMAAMFAGIWLMVEVIVAPSLEEMQHTAAIAEVEEEMEDYMMSSIDDYVVFESYYADNE